MSNMHEVVFEGMTKLQILELQGEFNPEVIRTIRNTSDLKLGSLPADTIVMIIMTLPIAKAIARMIVRDKTTFKYRRRRPDGTEEEAFLTITRNGPIDAKEDEIMKQLLGEITGGQEGSQV